jgi:hypothetical protein
VQQTRGPLLIVDENLFNPQVEKACETECQRQARVEFSFLDGVDGLPMRLFFIDT